MKTRVAIGKILKPHFKSCQSSLRLYKQLPRKCLIIICLIGPPRHKSDTILLYLTIKVWKQRWFQLKFWSRISNHANPAKDCKNSCPRKCLIIICLIGPPRQQIRHDFVVFYHHSMKTRVTIGKTFKWHFKSCQSSPRLYKQLPSKVSDHNWSYRSTQTQIRHDFVVFYH